MYGSYAHREYEYWRDTTFVVDNFHGFCHRCSPAMKAPTYTQLDAANTSASEQVGHRRVARCDALLPSCQDSHYAARGRVLIPIAALTLPLQFHSYLISAKAACRSMNRVTFMMYIEFLVWRCAQPPACRAARGRTDVTRVAWSFCRCSALQTRSLHSSVPA